MIKKTLDQYIFDEMFKRSLMLNYPTYDYKPNDETSYPFVEMGNTSTDYVANKSTIRNDVDLTIHIWGTKNQRKQVSEMAINLMNEAINLDDSIRLIVNQSFNRMLDDNSTNTALKHAVLELKFMKI